MARSKKQKEQSEMLGEQRKVRDTPANYTVGADGRPVADQLPLDFANTGAQAGPGKKPSRADLLPLISEFDREDMDTALELMQADLRLQEEIEILTEGRKAIKQQLVGLSTQYPTAATGMRWGQMAIYIRRGATKRTLSPTKLVENGVSADTVQDSYVTSKPYDDVRVVDLSKPKKGTWDGSKDGGEGEEDA